jgi:hypothetical protein
MQILCKWHKKRESQNSVTLSFSTVGVAGLFHDPDLGVIQKKKPSVCFVQSRQDYFMILVGGDS